jgi:hypothetical protein
MLQQVMFGVKDIWEIQDEWETQSLCKNERRVKMKSKGQRDVNFEPF